MLPLYPKNINIFPINNVKNAMNVVKEKIIFIKNNSLLNLTN